MRLYLDSDVWLTLFDKNDVRHSIVMELFEKIKEEGHTIVVSSVHLKEMENAGMLNEFNKKISEIKTERVFPTPEERKKARELNKSTGVGFDDCLHLTIAVERDAFPSSYDDHWNEIRKKLDAKVFMPGELLNP